MANLAVSNTFSAGTEIQAGPFNTNFSDIVTYINNRNGGGTGWDALTVTGVTSLQSTLAVSGIATFSAAIQTTGTPSTLFGYRRPNLTWISATAVDIENNTGTSNETTVIFPDGNIRSVTEDTSSTNKYRRFLITATAEFTSGTEDSGLYTGLSETNNTWYALYAVKSQIDATKFVLVGTTTLPIRANFSTLNTNLGTNAWVYLGMIRNGDSLAAPGDIIKFIQHSSLLKFLNPISGTGSGKVGTGIEVATGSSSVTYTYSAGTGDLQIPNHIKFVYCLASTGTAVATGVVDANNTYTFAGFAGINGIHAVGLIYSLDGIRVDASGAGIDISIQGIHDPILEGTYHIL